MDSIRAQSPSFPSLYGTDCNGAAGNASECGGVSNGGQGISTQSAQQETTICIAQDGFIASDDDSPSVAYEGLQLPKELRGKCGAESPLASVAQKNTEDINTDNEEEPTDVGGVVEHGEVGLGLGLDIFYELGERACLSAAASTVGGVVGGALLWGGSTVLGGVQIAKGVRTGDGEQIAGGASNLLDGTSRGLEAISLATAGSSSAVKSTISKVAGKIATPIGLGSAAIDFTLGTKDLVSGVKQRNKELIASGAIDMALGVTWATMYCGAGIPALVVAGGLYAAKTAMFVKDAIANYKRNHNEQGAPVETSHNHSPKISLASPSGMFIPEPSVSHSKGVSS